MKFKKKPVTVDAMKFEDTPEVIRELEKFCDGKFEILPKEHGIHGPGLRQAIIETLEDGSGQHQVRHFATEGDWIIKGIKGEFYACKSDIFEATYESAEPVRFPDKLFVPEKGSDQFQEKLSRAVPTSLDSYPFNK